MFELFARLSFAMSDSTNASFSSKGMDRGSLKRRSREQEKEKERDVGMHCLDDIKAKYLLSCTLTLGEKKV